MAPNKQRTDVGNFRESKAYAPAAVSWSVGLRFQQTTKALPEEVRNARVSVRPRNSIQQQVFIAVADQPRMMLHLSPLLGI